MELFSFIIISLINLIFSISQKNGYNLNINNDIKSDEFDPLKCMPDLSNITDIFNILNKTDNWTDISICILKKIRDSPDQAYIYFINYSPFFNNLASFIPNEALKKVFSDFFNKSKPMLNDTFDLIKTKSYSKSILDYLIDILISVKNGNGINFTTLKKVFKFPGFYEYVYKYYHKYKDILFDIIELLPKEQNKKKTIAQLFFILKDFVQKYQDVLFELYFKLTSHFKEYDNIALDIREFILDNRTNVSFLEDLRTIIKNKTLIIEVCDIINFDDGLGNTIVKKILLDEKLTKLFIDLLHNKTFVIEFTNILGNLTEADYLTEHIPIFLKDVIKGNITTKNIILNAFQNIVRNVLTEKSLKTLINNGISGALGYLIYEDFNRHNISPSCRELFNYTYFRPLKDVKDDFRFYYGKKLIFDSTKSKNDFLTYENCLNGKSKYDNILYGIKPIFVLGRIVDKYNQSKLKNSMYYEKYNYMISFCFPQGINTTTNESLCTDRDYGKLILIFNAVSNNVENAEIKVFNITEKDLNDKTNKVLYFSLIVIISAIPLFIYIFLKLYEIIKLYNPQKKEINNQLISEKQNKINENIKSNTNKKKKSLYRIKPPKWFRFLNEYFNLAKNVSELFNFSLNQTNFNDFNGITYIKGILGISMILNIFGLNFLILANLLHKILGSYQLYFSINNLGYILPFIGLRYCPRIIFSCSGYTLIYKFLNFIEHDSNFCFFKFLILQSYKFILLIIASIYLRFCITYIDVFFLKINNPISLAFNEELKQNNSGYFINLISFLFYNIRNEENIFINESAFIPYLYLPINEIFLFIVGIALISLGYKFKIRFDLIIIFSFIIIYLFKIILYMAYLYKQQIYSTLYFFLRGYGLLMLNPIFNLPSFLVGMYFGLVNFTIQRGINDLNKEEKLKVKEYELIEKEQIAPLKEEKVEEINRIDLCINSITDISESDKISRALTFNRQNSDIYNNNNIFVNDNNKSFIEGYENDKKNLDINMLMEANDILTEMPFLKSTVYFSDFHRKNQDTKLLKIFVAICIILIVFFISVRYIFISILIDREITKSKTSNVKRISDILSLEDLISNGSLNFIYVIDIELVVIMINWVFFFSYFKGGQINDFLSHIYWSFFIKSYFSYSLVSSLVILYILYQSETVIKLDIYASIQYSLISSFFIFIAIIIFYSFYEYPLRKIFKTLKIRRAYINLDDDKFNEEENEY